MFTSTHVLQEALKLPEQERAELAARLLESLDSAAEEVVEQDWELEIQRRIEQVESGAIQCVPMSQALDLIAEVGDEPALP